jgi:hypothetical protein
MMAITAIELNSKSARKREAVRVLKTVNITPDAAGQVQRCKNSDLQLIIR